MSIEKDKILKMLGILFPESSEEAFKEVAEVILECPQFSVDTDLRLGHFLAQAREEMGPSLKPVQESLNYSSDALKKLFKVFKEHPELADKYGRNSEHSANQEMIANYCYANRLGNGPVESGDGWNFRGRFSLQITGKSNYSEVQKRIDKYLPGSGIDICKGQKVDELKTTIVAGLAFWVWKDLYKLANGKSKEDVDSVTGVINKFTDSYEHRSSHFSKISHLI